MLTFTSGWHGLHALRHKREPTEMRTPGNLALYGVTILSSVVVLWLGLRLDRVLLVALSPIGALIGLGANRILPFEFQAGFGIVVWLLPAAVGTAAIFLLDRKYRRRFGEEGT